MRTLRDTLGFLLMIPPILTGCSSTSGMRMGAAQKIRTIASVGDKPLPVVGGESGSSVAGDEYAPERAENQEGRVSGRVVDERGEPISNARVRLALGSAPGGKVVRATTDPSGAFTMHGLRPGGSYTLIAEGEDDRGLLSGRSAAVRAPQSQVQISLLPEKGSAGASLNPKTSVSPISNATDEEDEEEESATEMPVRPSRRDEVPPPATEAEALAPLTQRRSRVATAVPVDPTDNRTPMPARWRRGVRDQAEAPPMTRPAAETSDGDPAPVPDDDDGPNPLPPALEREHAFVAPGGAPKTKAPGKAKKNKTVADAEPGARVVVPETFTPIALADDSESTRLPPTFTSPPARPRPTTGIARASRGKERGLRVAKTVKPARSLPPDVPEEEVNPPRPVREETTSPPGVNRDPFAAENATSPQASRDPFAEDVPAARESPSPPRPRTTWKELAVNQDDVPFEGSATAAGRALKVANRTEDPRVSSCRFDPVSRRLVDFRLPDLEGKPVRFHDLDADFILVHFWKTSSKACVQSIPHLVALQKRMGNRRVQVVGIACEEGPPEERAQAVAKAVQQFGIHYPVLLSGMDTEHCPVQDALHIQAFPSLILFDRNGGVLWRDEGGTRQTLTKLDQFVEFIASAKSESQRRY